MKNSEKFLKHLFKTGDATTEDIAKFMIEEYFLKDKTFVDFENDLKQVYGHDNVYTQELIKCLRDDLSKYSKNITYSVCKKHTLNEIKINVQNTNNDININPTKNKETER